MAAGFLRKGSGENGAVRPPRGGARVAQLLVEGGPVDDQGRYGLATRSAKVPARSAGASGATGAGAGSFYVRTGVLDWTGVLRSNKIQSYSCTAVYYRQNAAMGGMA